MKRLIHKQARESLQALLPNLDKKDCDCGTEVHWNLFKVLAFNPWIDSQTGAVRVGSQIIARALGKSAVYHAKRFNAGKYLHHFLQDVIPGIATLVVDEQGREWSTSTWVLRSDGSSFKSEDGKERRVLINWPSEVKTILEKEINKEYKDEKVYISNGLKRNSGKERQYLKLILEECQQEIEILDCEPAKEIASYLNSLPTNNFTKLLENFEEARKEANRLEGHAKFQQLLILDTIMEAPKPFVKPSERTDRLFGRGANLANLKKDVRKVLTKGWYEADLKSAQLAIVATLWDIPEVKDFLKTGESFWSNILEFLGAPLEAKSLIKDYTYGVIFGMSRERLETELTEELKKFGVDNKFLSHPIISSLLKARTKYIQKVKAQGYIIDAFGKKFSVKNDVLSLIARQAQSYEMALIHPVFQLAEQTEDFSIQLYQFDGVSLKFHNSSRKDHWINLISEVVAKKAEELNIYTSLDITENTDKFTMLKERVAQKEFELLSLVEEKKNDLPLHTTGVYCIFDTSSNRAYFGQSVDVYQRIVTHQRQLANNTHVNNKLQRAFNKNPGSLIGFLAQTVPYTQLDEAESYYINYFKTHKYGFNQINKLR